MKKENNKGITGLFKRVMRKVFGTGWVRPDYIEQKVFECEKCEAELLMDPKELSKDLNGGCDFCTEVEPKAKKKSAKRKTTKKKTTSKKTAKKKTTPKKKTTSKKTS